MPLELAAFLGIQARRAHKDIRGLSDIKDPRDIEGLLDIRGVKALRDNPERLEYPAIREIEDRSVPLELAAFLGIQARRGHKDTEGLLDIEVPKDIEVLLDIKVPLDKPEILGPKVRLAIRAFLAERVAPEMSEILDCNHQEARSALPGIEDQKVERAPLVLLEKWLDPEATSAPEALLATRAMRGILKL